jgi:outer membrane immunogenic protein
MAIALVGGSQTAFAADKPLPPPLAPAPAQVVNWTGFYVGGDIGGDFASSRFKRPGSGLSDTTIGSIDPGLLLGVHAGFNYQVAPWVVLGVEAERTWLAGANYREFGPALDLLQQTHYVDDVAGRVGIVLRPDTMVYGKVGPAWINVSGFLPFSTNTFSQTLLGAQAGIGIETLVTQNLALRAEASYTQANQVLSLSQGFDRYRPSLLFVKVGAEYKFDAPGGWGMQASAAPVAADAKPAPAWTGIEVGGFASVNGNIMKYFDTLNGESGPYAHPILGGGGFIGANYQIHDFVIGAEVSGDIDRAHFLNAAGSGGLTGTFYDFASIDNVLAVTARGGWLATPDTLVYVKGGPAWIQMATNQDYWNSIAPNVTGSETFPGFQAGVGFETFVTSNVSVRVEGLYTHVLGHVSLNGTIMPNEFALQPAVMAATTGVALHF